MKVLFPNWLRTADPFLKSLIGGCLPEFTLHGHLKYLKCTEGTATSDCDLWRDPQEQQPRISRRMPSILNIRYIRYIFKMTLSMIHHWSWPILAPHPYDVLSLEKWPGEPYGFLHEDT